MSTDKQTVENQRFEILQFTAEKQWAVDKWIDETASGMKRVEDRKLGKLLKHMKKGDMLLVTELSRLGRSLMEVMSILHDLMDKDIKVFTVKERYELGHNINSEVLAFAFSLSAEIERNMISSRTKEALARKKAEGMILGRPKGSLSKVTKLTGKDEQIEYYLGRSLSYSAMGRIFRVNRKTVKEYIKSRNLIAKSEINHINLSYTEKQYVI